MSVARTDENYIVAHRDALSERHYTLMANIKDHRFNAWPNPLREYRQRCDDDFCLVVFRTGPKDDAYVMPFTRIEPLFTEQGLEPSSGSAGRWIGSIRNGYLTVDGSDESVSVAEYHNAFHLLQN